MLVNINVRAWFVWFGLALALAFLPLDTARAQPAPAGKIDCASSALPMPSGFSGECKSQNESGTGNYGCSKINYIFRAADGQPGPRFFGRLIIGTQAGCGIAINNPLDELKRDAGILRTDSTNWSDEHKGDGSDIYWTFDRASQNPNGKCFAYRRNGPPLTAKGPGVPSYTYVVIGFFCKAPGQPLDDAAVRTMLSAVKVNSR